MHISVRKTIALSSYVVLGVVAVALVAAGTGAASAAETAAAGAEPALEPAVEAPQTFFGYFLAGGKLMWAILACSVVALAFVIERWIALHLHQDNVVNNATYNETIRLLEAEGPDDARSYAADHDSPMSRVIWAVLSCADSPRAEMESIVENAGARELWELQRNAKPLGIISNVAPLLGLLGTVIGIIRAFSDVATEAGAIGNPKMLATGIYEALITTAAGLSVAIPAYLFYHFFRSRADALVRDIEEKALGLIAAIFDVRGKTDSQEDTRPGVGSVADESA